jgi:hypothetical protein
LFGSWFVAGAFGAMGQVPSRLCSLPELFAFPSDQIFGSDSFSESYRDFCWDSPFVFSSAMAAENLTSHANNRFIAPCKTDDRAVCQTARLRELPEARLSNLLPVAGRCPGHYLRLCIL